MDISHISITPGEIVAVLMSLVAKSLREHGEEPFPEEDLPKLYAYMIAAFELGTDYGEADPSLTPAQRLKAAVQIRNNKSIGTSMN